MKSLLVHLLEAGPLLPSLPVRHDLGGDRTPELLLDGLQSLRVVRGTRNPRHTREPCTDVEVILTRLGTVDEAGLGEKSREVDVDEGGDVSPVLGGEGVPVGGGDLATEELGEVVDTGELVSVELEEGGGVRGDGVFLQSGLACGERIPGEIQVCRVGGCTYGRRRTPWQGRSEPSQTPRRCADRYVFQLLSRTVAQAGRTYSGEEDEVGVNRRFVDLVVDLRVSRGRLLGRNAEEVLDNVGAASVLLAVFGDERGDGALRVLWGQTVRDQWRMGCRGTYELEELGVEVLAVSDCDLDQLNRDLELFAIRRDQLVFERE